MCLPKRPRICHSQPLNESFLYCILMLKRLNGDRVCYSDVQRGVLAGSEGMLRCQKTLCYEITGFVMLSEGVL